MWSWTEQERKITVQRIKDGIEASSKRSGRATGKLEKKKIEKPKKVTPGDNMLLMQGITEYDETAMMSLSKQNVIIDRFDRNTLYATAAGNSRKVTELPSFRYYDKLYCLWNFIKHNSLSTYKKVSSKYPDLIREGDEYKQGFPALYIITFTDELIIELLNGCS